MVGFSAKSWKELITACTIKNRRPNQAHIWTKIGKRLVSSFVQAWKHRNRSVKGADCLEKKETSTQVSIENTTQDENLMKQDIISAPNNAILKLLVKNNEISHERVISLIITDLTNPTLLPPSNLSPTNHPDHVRKSLAQD